MKKYIFNVFALVMILTGCTDLQEKIYDTIPESKFPENSNQTANIGVGAYDPLKELLDGGGWWFCQELTTDEMVAPTRGLDWDDNGKWRALQLHSWTNETEAVVGMWDRYYRGIAECNKTIEILIASVRQIASALRPSILDDFGLNAALHWQCAEFQNLNGIQCIFIPGFDDGGLSVGLKTALFRIAQESLTNVMRHAKAGKVSVRTKEYNECIYLYIIDNGKGFNIEQSKTTLGLIGLRERAVSLGGELEIESQIGKGTTISAIVPKKQHHENFNRG